MEQLQFQLLQNYPNPFNPITNFEFSVADYGIVSLKIYDVLGNEIATIVNEYLSPGNYKYDWDASAFSSGVYFYRLEVFDPETNSGQGFVDTKKLILMK